MLREWIILSICYKPFVISGHCKSAASRSFYLICMSADSGLIWVHISVNGVSLSSVFETAFPTSSSVMPHVILTDGIPWSCSEKCSPVFVLIAFFICLCASKAV